MTCGHVMGGRDCVPSPTRCKSKSVEFVSRRPTRRRVFCVAAGPVTPSGPMLAVTLRLRRVPANSAHDPRHVTPVPPLRSD